MVTQSDNNRCSYGVIYIQNWGGSIEMRRLLFLSGRLSLCLGVFVVAVVGAAVSLYAINPNTLVTNWDARVYMSTAQSLSAGIGLYHPSTADLDLIVPLKHFPPGYPIVLSGLMFAGFSVHGAAIVLASFGFIATVCLAFVVVAKVNSCRAVAWMLPLFTMLSTAPYYVFFRMMSESLFFPVLCIAIISISRFAETNSKPWMCVSCIFVSFLPVIRYLGVSAIGAICLFLLVWDSDHRVARLSRELLLRNLKRTLACGFMGSIPTLCWLFYMHSNGGLRDAQNPTMLKQRFVEVIETLHFYVMPFGVSFGIKCITAVCLVLATVVLFHVAYPQNGTSINFSAILIFCRGFCFLCPMQDLFC